MECRAGPSRAGSTGLLTPPPTWGGRGRGKVEPEADEPACEALPEPGDQPDDLGTCDLIRQRITPPGHTYRPRLILPC